MTPHLREGVGYANSTVAFRGSRPFCFDGFVFDRCLGFTRSFWSVSSSLPRLFQAISSLGAPPKNIGIMARARSHYGPMQRFRFIMVIRM